MKRFVLLLLGTWTLLLAKAKYTSIPCNFQRIGDGVCVCNVTYCDTLDVPEPDCGEYIMVTSSKSGKRFDITNLTDDLLNVTVPSNRWLKIDVNQTFEKIIGFGGALTDSTSSLIASMELPLRHCVYTSYVSAVNGAAYQIFRMPLGGSDFSDEPWAYNEQPENDFMLMNMTKLHPWDQRRVEQIKELRTLLPNSTLKLMLCAWSPPLWMKSNKRWTGASYLLEEFYETWALYHAKALNLWRDEGAPIWSLSTGNEAVLTPVLPFMTLDWKPKDQKRWVSDFLKPILHENDHNDVQLIGLDDQRSTVPIYCSAFQRNSSDPRIDDLDMIGVHWYTDAVSDPNWLSQTVKRHEIEIPILYTESCTGTGIDFLNSARGVDLGSWIRCQEYVQRMIRLFSHDVSGFIDWNMVLDTQGGPNYIQNFVDAPMIFDQHNQTLYKQPMFYGIAHFSKFLHSNCTRIGSELSLISSFNIDAIAFSCSNYTKVVIMYNQKSSSEQIAVIDKNVKINLVLDASSVNTLIYRDC